MAESCEAKVILINAIAYVINGYVLDVVATTANVHDSKDVIQLTARILSDFNEIGIMKADMGYAALKNTVSDIGGFIPECVKSNFGTPDFIPIQESYPLPVSFR